MTEPLHRLLDGIETGPITGQLTTEVISALTDNWEGIEGSMDTAMDPSKLHRAESLHWDPPVLTFLIERHGGTVLGSTRAELQLWSIDLEANSAEWTSAGRRQVGPKSPAWSRAAAQAAAEEIAAAMRANRNKPYLQWTKDRRKVRIRVQKVVPPGPKQTVEGRISRLQDSLSEVLTGWTQNAGGWWTVKDAGDEE